MLLALHPLVAHLLVLGIARPHAKQLTTKPYIIRGSQANPHEFPAIVSMQFLDKRSGWRHFCGGVLIGPTTVLTAAHCRIYKPVRKRVVIGAHRLSAAEGDASVRKVGLAKEIPHPQFTFVTMAHDLMLLRLNKAVAEAATIRFDRLPPVEGKLPPLASTDCTIAGWGKISDTGGASDVLMQGPMTAKPDRPAVPTKLIALPGGPTSSSGCRGDSGGPLYCPAPAGDKLVLVGMVSKGEDGGCGTETGYIEFARVDADLSWIKGNM